MIHSPLSTPYPPHPPSPDDEGWGWVITRRTGNPALTIPHREGVQISISPTCRNRPPPASDGNGRIACSRWDRPPSPSSPDPPPSASTWPWSRSRPEPSTAPTGTSGGQENGLRSGLDQFIVSFRLDGGQDTIGNWERTVDKLFTAYLLVCLRPRAIQKCVLSPEHAQRCLSHGFRSGQRRQVAAGDACLSKGERPAPAGAEFFCGDVVCLDREIPDQQELHYAEKDFEW